MSAGLASRSPLAILANFPKRQLNSSGELVNQVDQLLYRPERGIVGAFAEEAQISQDGADLLDHACYNAVS